MEGGTSGALWRFVARAKRRTEIPVVLCIDVEPDPRVYDRRDPPSWLGFERFIRRLPALRQHLQAATGAPVAFTWCLRMDPQVAETWGSAGWVAETYADTFAELLACGDELGLHTHLWRWEHEGRTWIADYDDPAWAELCISAGLDAFKRSFGRACKVHRGGDHFLSGAMLSCLSARGVEIDLTVEPSRASEPMPENEIARGTRPDYRGLPTQPYRSSPARFPAPDPSIRTGPLLVPLLSARARRPPFRRYPLSPEMRPGVFAPRLAAELVTQPPSVIAFASRTDCALGPRWDTLVKNLDHLARHDRMPFVTASDAVDLIGTAKR